MPRKGMRSIFFHPSPRHAHHRSPSSAASSTAAPASPHHTFSASMMEDNISQAREIINKWDTQGSPFDKVTSLFHESRDEARLFLRTVLDLQRAMRFFVADSSVSSSDLIVRAQTLMQAGMRRLQREFYQILSANRDCLDPESVSASARSSLSLNSTASSISDLEDEEIRAATESIGEVERVSALAMADLRAIAECMISCGYGKECVKIYKTIRRSIVDEGLYKLGFEKQTPAQVQKLDWEVLDIRMRSWHAASKVAVRTLFSGERVLCDHVFASSDIIRESCFADISSEPAVNFFGFPQLVASKRKRSPERVFRILDLHQSISELWPEIESIFSYESTSAVRSQAVSSRSKLGEAVRSLIADFESAIHKDNSKVAVPGGGLHPLTRHVMNYVASLADYSNVLADIYADYPLQMPAPLPESFFGDPALSSEPSSPSFRRGKYTFSPISIRFAWLILVLVCKLDSKAELFRNVPLAYLFLANNLQYVVNEVRRSRLAELLGEEWAARNEAKARGYAASYERLAWSKVLSALSQGGDDAAPDMDSRAAAEWMQQFTKAFEGAYREQAGWVLADGKMRDELKISIARKVVPAYRALYERCRVLLGGAKDTPAVMRLAPEDLGNYISDLFYGDGRAAGSSSSSEASWRST